jgi:tetratricopeptide (TPR) repeat protein
MLVVEPSNLRFEETGQAGGALDEHLLERVTLLENNLSRVMDKLEKTLDLMLKQAQSSHTSHALLDALISTLAETGALNRRLLQTKWLAREARGDEAAPDAEDRPASVGDVTLARIVARYDGAEAEEFRREAAEGLELVRAGKFAAAAKALGRASARDPQNAALDALLGRVLFVAGRPARAVEHLLRAARYEPGNPSHAGALGMALGDTGDAARAAELLRGALACGFSTFAVHFSLGRLAAARAKWREAASEFKAALALSERAEAHYGLGLAHARLGHARAAERHLRRALALEGDHAEARRLLASLGARAGRRRPAPPAARPESEGPARRLVTGGSARLLRMFAAELLGPALSR